MLGTDVVAAAAAHDVVALARAQLDVTDAEAVREVMRDARPDAVVNCAAWTDVDGAESAEAEATAINGDGAGHVAAAAAEAGAFIVHVSTDYVFAGDAREPYAEADSDRSAHGLRALEAGRRARRRRRRAGRPRDRPHRLAVRAPRRQLRRHDAAARRRARRAVAWSTTRSAARPTPATSRRRWSRSPRRGRTASCTSPAAAAARGTTSRSRRSSAPAWRSTVTPCTTADFPRPAPRPAFSVLGSTRHDQPTLPPWQEGLAAHLAARKVHA